MRFVRFFIIAGIMSFTTLSGATSVFAAAQNARSRRLGLTKQVA